MLSQVENDIKAWDAIVDHRTGTQGDHDTARWLVEQALKPGLDPTLDWFDFTRRVPGRCEVACGENLARGLPLFDGPVTSADPVIGRAGHIGAPCEIALAPFTPASIHSGTRALYQARATVRPLGEARNIFDAGGRFASLLGDNRWFHNPADRWPAAVDLEQCEALVNFVLDLAVDLARA